MAQRLKAALPYLVGLAIAGVLYHVAGNINYPARPGQLGPDFWPRLALAVIAIVCLYEIVRLIVVGSAEGRVQGIAEHLEGDDFDGEEGQANAGFGIYMLLGGLALVLAYAVLVPALGFLLASYAFLILFMYLGGIRNHLAIWASSTIGMLLFAFIFLKVVYVSLPRGVPPFDQVTQFVMDLMLVR